MDYQRLADTILRNQALLRVENDSRFGVVAYFRSLTFGRISMVKLLKNPGMNTKFILDKVASGLLQCFHPGLLAMVTPPQIPYGLFPYSANSKLLSFECFENDLSKLITQKMEEKTRFTEAQLGSILRRIVSTLYYLGTINIHHGCLTPENIFLIQGNPKIVPTLFFEEAGRPSLVKITPYSPPEDIAAKNYGGPVIMRDPYKADIFSLGVTILHAALLDQFIPINKSCQNTFDEAALAKNLSKLSPTYSVTMVVILQKMTSPNLKNRLDLSQLSDLLITLNDPVAIPSSMTNSVKTCFFGGQRFDTSNSYATPAPCPTPNVYVKPPTLTRMASARPPPVITTHPQMAHLTLTIEVSPTEPCQSMPSSAKLPVMKSSPAKPMQHKWIASPPHLARSATERKANTMVQSQQLLRLARMETVAEVDLNQVLLTETTPEKIKKFDKGFSDIQEVVSDSSKNNNNNVAEFAAESQILAESLAESRVCSDNSNIGALKDLFNFYPQLKFFNQALRNAPLVEEEITKRSMVGQLTFSTALLKHRLVDKDVHKSGEKGVESITPIQAGGDEGAPMAVSTYFQEGASPTSPMRRPDLAASFAESRSNSNDTQEAEHVDFVREIYKDGSVYEGEKKFGKRHGNGQFNFKSGGQYKGAWFNGKMTGKGTLLYPDGSIAYEGEWLEGKFHGHGVLYNEAKQDLKASCQSTYYHNFDDSSAWVKYEGSFSYDLREGTGTIIFTDGSKFAGNFRCDKIDGYGKMHLANGDVLEGIWIENRLSQILNASPSSRCIESPTPCSTRSILSQRSPKMSPGTPSKGMMMSPLAGSNRNQGFVLQPTEPIIKPKAC